MNSPAPVQRPGRIRAVLIYVENTVSASFTIQSLLLLHCLSWSAESRIHLALLIIGLATVVFFYGCGHLAKLAYHTAVLFSYLVVVLKGLLKITFIITLFEAILNIVGYHSEDYKILKHKIELFFTEFSSISCILVLKTENDAVVLGPNDVINLCHAIWYILYTFVIAMGLYIGMPSLKKIRREDFWTNVYFSLLLVVVWKMFERFVFYGMWRSAKLQRTTCVFVHYIRYGRAGFRISNTGVFKRLT